MARIRSVHPGQWSDDDFVAISPLGRLLAIAIRNFADDNGVFEWKPTLLKRECLPNDNCDVVALLAELARPKRFGPDKGRGRVVQPFEVHGQLYGAIRNFHQWQRTKSPKQVHPLPAFLRGYVSLTEEISEITDAEVAMASEIASGQHEAISEMGALLSHVVSAKVVTRPAEVGGRRLDGGDIPKGKNPSGADAPQGSQKSEGENPPKPEPPDDRTWCFQNGLLWLTSKTSMADKPARAMVGKWLKAASDNASTLRRVLEDAIAAQPAEPIAWITKALEGRIKGNGGTIPAWSGKGSPPLPDGHPDLEVYCEEAQFIRRVKIYRSMITDQGYDPDECWSRRWGGTFPGDHPAHNRKIVVELLGEGFLSERNR